MIHFLLRWLIISCGLGLFIWILISELLKSYKLSTLLILVLINLLLIGSISFFSNTELEKTVEKTEDYPLVSLSLTTETQGDFFLGTGTVQGKAYYYFYLKNGNKYRLNKIPAEDTDLEESNNPIYEKKYSMPMVKNIPGKFNKLLGLNDAESDWHDVSDIYRENPKHILYIPKGSIKQNFSVDAHDKN